MDGTFKVVKKPFYQLFSIHGFIKQDKCVKQVPLCFVLMSSRRKKDYRKVFQSVHDILPSAPNVQKAVIDFEAAVW